jgi:hypothetical protein
MSASNFAVMITYRIGQDTTQAIAFASGIQISPAITVETIPQKIKETTQSVSKFASTPIRLMEPK